MPSRASLALLIAAGLLASASANAAGLSPNLNIRSPSLNNTAVMGGHVGHIPPTIAPTWHSSANDPYDQSTNLNPSSGGGVKPDKKPALK
jgi:hypothetical protein